MTSVTGLPFVSVVRFTVCCAIRSLEREKNGERQKAILPDNAGIVWSEEEDQRVSDEFRNDADIQPLGRHTVATRKIRAYAT